MIEQLLSPKNLDFLKRIRIKIIRLLILLAICFLGLLLIPEKLLNTSLSPIKEALGDYKLIFTDVSEKFFTHIRLAFWWSVLISIPIVLYEIVTLIKDEIYKKTEIIMYLFTSFGLFLFGFLLSWFLIIPKLVKFSLSLVWLETQLLPKLNDTVILSIKLSIYTGILIELPLIIHFLVKNGLLSVDFFKRHFYTMVFVLFFKNFFILPVDIVIQLFITFVEITIIYMMLIFFYKKRDRVD